MRGNNVMTILLDNKEEVIFSLEDIALLISCIGTELQEIMYFGEGNVDETIHSKAFRNALNDTVSDSKVKCKLLQQKMYRIKRYLETYEGE
jgi:hypothetical protein